MIRAAAEAEQPSRRLRVDGRVGIVTNPYRTLPSVDRLLQHPAVARLRDRYPNGRLTTHARAVLDRARASLAASSDADGGADLEALAQAVVASVEGATTPSLRPVLNATGVILHTNLGRAPLSAAALAAMERAGRGYSNLEFDLAAGKRGSRFAHLTALLREATGAEAGLAVNNNASALLLALSALAADREVIVSRGQAVEIGGGFRIPDVLRQSDATLVEVGTTNRTHADDYGDALNQRTAAILRVHASNFKIVGFTAQPALTELRRLASDAGVLLLDDLGSGCLLDTTRYGLAPEPRVQESVATGVDLTMFSGDKLLGGPQAGLIVGRADLIERLRRHPLARALRPDKSAIAGLAATLAHYLHDQAETEIPVWRMIAAPADGLRDRAEAWRTAIAAGSVEPSRSMVGGGSLPDESLPTFVLALREPRTDAGSLAAALRGGDPPLIARVEHDAVLLDPRTIDPSEDAAVVTALRSALSGEGR